MKLVEYMRDGADYQARCVLELLIHKVSNNERLSGNLKNDAYPFGGQVNVHRFMNCREQGYFVSAMDREYKTVIIAFSQNRNSDDIVVYWVDRGTSLDPSLDTLWGEGLSEPNKKYFRYHSFEEVAEFIVDILWKHITK